MGWLKTDVDLWNGYCRHSIALFVRKLDDVSQGCFVNKFVYTSLLILFMVAFGASNASARLDGAVEWGYTNYSESNDGQKDKTASSFTLRTFTQLPGTESVI